MWPHKNHLRLIDALKQLQDQYDLVIPLVLSGGSHAHEHLVRQRIARYHMADQVTHVGYVDPVQLKCLYRLAEALVFPSEFEGWGLPVTEAMSVGLPIVCSNIPSLVDQVGDAALLVDPSDTAGLAKHLKSIWLDQELRQNLREKAIKRSRLFDWKITATQFVEQYRQIMMSAL
jgi:glycosyltransferase involved in cell wall biosynthesis